MNRRHLIKTTIGAAAATVLPLPTEPDFGMFAKFPTPPAPTHGSQTLGFIAPWNGESEKMISQARAWAAHHGVPVYADKLHRKHDKTDHCYISFCVSGTSSLTP